MANDRMWMICNECKKDGLPFGECSLLIAKYDGAVWVQYFEPAALQDFFSDHPHSKDDIGLNGHFLELSYESADKSPYW